MDSSFVCRTMLCGKKFIVRENIRKNIVKTWQSSSWSIILNSHRVNHELIYEKSKLHVLFQYILVNNTIFIIQYYETLLSCNRKYQLWIECNALFSIFSGNILNKKREIGGMRFAKKSVDHISYCHSFSSLDSNSKSNLNFQISPWKSKILSKGWLLVG